MLWGIAIYSVTYFPWLLYLYFTSCIQICISLRLFVSYRTEGTDHVSIWILDTFPESTHPYFLYFLLSLKEIKILVIGI